MLATGAHNGEAAKLAEVQERTAAIDHRLADVEAELARWLIEDISEAEVAAALSEFDTVWAALKSSEQVAILNVLIERVDHNGSTGNVAITFLATGLKALSAQIAQHEETAALPRALQ